MKIYIGIGFVGLGVLALIMQPHLEMISAYPIVWYSVAGLLGAVGLYMMFGKTAEERKAEKALQKKINYLKQFGKRIQINADDCEIITNSYFKDIPRSSNYKSQAFDSAFNSENAAEQLKIDQSRISYKNLENNIVYFSPTINMDKTTLNLWLIKQQTLDLYLDKNDQDNFFFDLEFLKE